ncbi:Uncharacterised protein [Raoultella terrigena]|uniref:Uncharacterized protein n=1 Tax=Raoultella terrigena TaxID=577 RepID=A0A4U9DDH3_RAOTE|nr:Uncharacterised protein [Raoultella terrigena]
MSPFDKPRKGLVTLFTGGILFWPIKYDFFTAKTFQSLPNILTGFS